MNDTDTMSMTASDIQLWTYEYLPYVPHDPSGHEIPCFRIFPEDRPEEYIAETNENLPHDEQETHARLIAASPTMLSALYEARDQLEQFVASDKEGRDTDARKALTEVRKAIAEATEGGTRT